MIGYDFDGVFIPDFKIRDLKGKALEAALKWRTERTHTLFVPEGDYVIITGRPSCDKKYTMQWIKRELKSNPPKKVFHDCKSHELGADYKISVILNNDIELFIESDLTQAAKIQNATFVPTVVFSALVRKTLHQQLRDVQAARYEALP